MADSDRDPPIVGIPERLDRRMRLGPFPSSRDALKFVTYAAAGAVLSPFASPWFWLPVVLAGFVVCVWRPDGEAVDERLFAFVCWQARSLGARNPMRDDPPLVRQATLELPSGRYLAVIRTGGTPVAYLPPDELARQFELYRELLRSLGTSFSFLGTTVPVRSQGVRPSPADLTDRTATAGKGYSDLVTLLCRRRSVRRVYFVIGTTETGSDGLGRLEGRVANLIERLTALGLRPMRLRDRSLADAARRFGWSTAGSRE